MILGRTSDIHSERMGQEVLTQRQFIATQIKEVDITMDGRFKEVDQRFQEADKKMDARFKEVDKKSTRWTRQWESISMLYKMRHGTFYVSEDVKRFLPWDYLIIMVEFLPRNISLAPWGISGGLKILRRASCPSQTSQKILRLIRETVDRLIHLIRFYKIQGYEEWGRDADSLEGDSDPDGSSEDSSQSSRLPISLEVAVRSYPEIAHRALAAQLGLAYDEIQRFMERAKELSQAPVIQIKRGQAEQGEQASKERKKRSLKLSPEVTEVTSPTEPRSSQGRIS